VLVQSRRPERTIIMEPVGIDLKSIREEKKVSLPQIAQATRINLTHLRNLEEGHYSDMPGGIYNRAFLRAYCEYLKIEPAQYLDRYDAETNPPGERAPKSRARIPNQTTFEIKPHPLVAWGLMLLVSTVGLYFSRHWIAATFSPYFSRSPVTQISPSQSATQASQAQEPIPPASELPPALESTLPSRVPARSTAIPKEPPPAGTMRVEFHVLDKCWVSVNSDGARVLVKLLEPGEEQFFEATDRFYIILGNAGGVRLKINGKPAKVLGKPGEVVRVLINQQNLPELLERTTG
jgi:cytoskeleton protein RodZ